MTYVLVAWENGEATSVQSWSNRSYGDVVEIAANWAFNAKGITIVLYEEIKGTLHLMFRDRFFKAESDAHLGATEKHHRPAKNDPVFPQLSHGSKEEIRKTLQGWNWNNSPKECAREIVDSGFPENVFLEAMSAFGYSSEDIESVKKHLDKHFVGGKK